MKVALIPPLAYLEDTYKTELQLVLPHMMTEPQYAQWYNENATLRSHRFILDNGAAEGVAIDPHKYVDLALSLANEVALPDILYDRIGTIRSSDEFLNIHGYTLLDIGIDIGYVAQGRNGEDAFRGVEEIVARWNSVITVIYIPRLLIRPDSLEVRIDLAKRIHARWPHLAIHFFGMNQLWPGEILMAATAAPFIRSVDTSMPYQFAYAAEPMQLGRTASMREISRPNNYFDINPDNVLVNRNVAKILRWANGNLRTQAPDSKV